MIDEMWQLLEKGIQSFIFKVFKIRVQHKEWTFFLQFVKFGLVGILNNVISYSIYLILIVMEIHYMIANIVGFSISIFNSYYWNNKYVFVEGEKRTWWKTLLKTYLSYAFTGIILSNILLIVWVEILCISEFCAPIINLFVTIPINFIVNKLWAYREK